jgi:hypothetical protein
MPDGKSGTPLIFVLALAVSSGAGGALQSADLREILQYGSLKLAVHPLDTEQVASTSNNQQLAQSCFYANWRRC